jgi:tetratricopeptide (TPR) repeat protein
MRYPFQTAWLRGGVLAVGLLVGSAASYADTIVLKNGRRILAMNAVEVGDKIVYETSAGELSLPKAIVDHIEKDGLVPRSRGDAAGGSRSGGGKAADASNLAITPPSMDAGRGNAGEIERAAIHDGAIDREYIAKLEGDARGGSATAAISAAAAHHAAATFELAHGDMNHALDDERTALMYAPEEPVLLMDVAYMHLRRSEYKESLDYLERARRVAPNDADVAKLEGWAYYGMNKMDLAVAEWKRSLALRPDAEVQAALEKAQRDKQEEENYKENDSSHFTLRYSGSAEPALAREVLHVLEEHYTAIESELQFSPPEPIGVILYTQQAFADITKAPNWVGALNDGRLRVPVQGLSSVTPELSRVLKHELTHSFVQQKTHGRAPTWIQEGLAQWMEGKRSGENAAVLLQIYEAGQQASLGNLEGSWMNFSGQQAAYAYAWALANVEYIVQADGMGDMERILERIGAGEATEAAIREVVRGDYAELTRGTVEYLKRNYR